MENLTIYNSLREVPKEAQKPIAAGRLKGMTDINPMWRIKALTEQFGPAGIGWYYEVIEKRLEKGCKDQISAFVDIHLFVKYDGEWSKPIFGTGGSSFVTQESKGPYQSDECFKMALTDAISVACKALGCGANVYWQKDKTKYDKSKEGETKPNISEAQIKRLNAIAYGKGYDKEAVIKASKSKYKIDDLSTLSKAQYDEMCKGYEGLDKKNG